MVPKWRPRYSKKQRILINGDGDFSFAERVAREIGDASNMVATSLDTRDELLKKYGKKAELNISNLIKLGAQVLHGIDACKMAMPEQRNLLCGYQMAYFDRIIFNLPHVGFSFGPESDPHVIEKQKDLLRLFYENATQILSVGGQVHLSHKLGPPYDEWQLLELAEASGLRLVKQVPFHPEHYPGYQNRRGDDSRKFRAGESFDLGPAATYIFEARIEVPPTRTWNVGEPLGMRTSKQAHVKSLKQKAAYKAGASHVTSLQQVVADEATGLEKLQLGEMKMKTSATLKPTSQQMISEKSPTSLSCTTKESPARALNACEPVGLSTTMTKPGHLKWVVRKAGAPQVTSLQQVLGDEVTGLENLQLGKKQMKTLETPKPALQQMNLSSCQGPLEALAEDLGIRTSKQAHVKSLKQKAAYKAGASHMTSLQQVVADEATGLEKLQLGEKKMMTLATLKPTSQQMISEKSPTSLSCTTKESPAGTSNVCEPVGLSTTMTKPGHLKWVVRKAGAPQVTSLQHVLADEVTSLEKQQLGKKQMKTLETPEPALQQTTLSSCQGPVEALAEDLGGSLEEEHAKIIEMDMASLSNSTTVNFISQNVGCTESTLPPFRPQPKLEDMDVVSCVNPNYQVLVLGREETSKSLSTLDSSLELSQGSAGTISTIDKFAEEVKEDCTTSKQKSPLQEIQLVVPLQRNVSCAAVDQHVNSALNAGHDLVGRNSATLAHPRSRREKAVLKALSSQVIPFQQVVADEVARLKKVKEEEKLGEENLRTFEILESALQRTNLDNFQLVEASGKAFAQDVAIVLEEENEEIIAMDMAASASLSNAADIEWVSQSSGCTKSLSPETVDLSFQITLGNEASEKAEDTTNSGDILEPSPQFSKVFAETISTVDKVEEDINVDCQSSNQESYLLGIQRTDDMTALQKKNLESSQSEESSGLKEESVGCLTALPKLWEVLWRHLQRI